MKQFILFPAIFLMSVFSNSSDFLKVSKITSKATLSTKQHHATCNITFIVKNTGGTSFSNVHLEDDASLHSDYYNVANQTLGTHSVTGGIYIHLALTAPHASGRVKIVCGSSGQVYCQNVAANATSVTPFYAASPCCGSYYEIYFETGVSC